MISRPGNRVGSAASIYYQHGRVIDITCEIDAEVFVPKLSF
jgi:hypothetical protein